jgi:DNA-binding NarL/FixJ family response regulator
MDPVVAGFLNKEVRMLAKVLVRPSSYIDGLALLAEAGRLHPDVITMPRFDGIEAARRLRGSNNPARLAFLTVHEDRDFARAALAREPGAEPEAVRKTEVDAQFPGYLIPQSLHEK